MHRSPATFALASISVVPLILAAASGAPQDETDDLEGPPFGPAYDDAPVFDGSLPPGTVEVARHPLRWSQRDPQWEEAGRTSEWPADVDRAFVEIMQRPRGEGFDVGTLYADLRVGEEWESCPRAFRAMIPGGVEVYAAAYASGTAGATAFSVLLRRPSTGAVSPRFWSIWLRWPDIGEKGPKAYWADVDGDGDVELGIQLHHHNGTASDGDHIRWFRITDDLDFELVHVSPVWDWVSVVSRREDGQITYRLLREPDGTLRDEGWFDNPAFGVGPVHARGNTGHDWGAWDEESR